MEMPENFFVTAFLIALPFILFVGIYMLFIIMYLKKYKKLHRHDIKSDKTEKRDYKRNFNLRKRTIRHKKKINPIYLFLVGLFLLVFEPFYYHIPLNAHTRFIVRHSDAAAMCIVVIAVALIVIGSVLTVIAIAKKKRYYK